VGVWGGIQETGLSLEVGWGISSLRNYFIFYVSPQSLSGIWFWPKAFKTLFTQSASEQVGPRGRRSEKS